MTRALSAVAGLGFSALSRKPIGTTRKLALDAIVAATKDAGLDLSDIDGLIITRSASAPPKDLPLEIQSDLGISELKLLSILDAEGASAVIALQQATMAIQGGMASRIACVFADARVQGNASGRGFARVMPVTGIPDWESNYGLFGAVGPYALEAQRFLHQNRMSTEDLGSYVMAVRQWACANPLALQTEPLTLSQYLESRWIVEPLRLLDCAYPVNGAIAVVLTATDGVSADGNQPVFVHGFGQGHNRSNGIDIPPRGSLAAAKRAYGMAGIGPEDVTMCQFYDAFSYLALQQLEDYGICSPGTSGAFVQDGNTAPGGRMPINTGGGHLAGYYLHGMTPISEAVIQARGARAARQTPQNDIILVTGNGGIANHHAAMILSPHLELN